MNRVHLIVPFASPCSGAGHEALSRLATPALDALMAGWREVERDEGDEFSLATPHERVLAKALGWRVNDEMPLPWAARQAAADGIDVGDAAWGLVTPVHWRGGAEETGASAPARFTSPTRARWRSTRPRRARCTRPCGPCSTALA
jgi:hypothetical protein